MNLFVNDVSSTLIFVVYVMNEVKGLVQDPKVSSKPSHDPNLHPIL